MKKIMFNDKYGLTKAILDGRKTQTRRLVQDEFFSLQWGVRDDTLVVENEFGEFVDIRETKYCMFKVGEIVAVAQSYKDAGYSPDYIFYRSVAKIDGYKKETACCQKGWNNKMFVAPNLMPHEIRITNVRIERLQDISDEDCLKEGVVISEPKKGGARMYYPCEYLKSCANKIGWGRVYLTPREAYAVLIDIVSGEGTWDKNPWVWAYDFELVK